MKDITSGEVNEDTAGTNSQENVEDTDLELKPAGPTPLSERCRFWPPALCGLALGNIGLGNALRLFLTRGIAGWAAPWPTLGIGMQIYFLTFALVPLSMFAMKTTLHFPFVLQELQDWKPAAGIVSAGAMAIGQLVPPMLSISSWGAAVVWYSGFALHLLLMLNFVYQRVSQLPYFSWEHCTPAWYIATVGICIFALTSEGVPHIPPLLVDFSLYLGVAWTGLLLPFITYRLWAQESMSDKFLPTTTIAMAPPAMLTAAWLALNEGPPAIFAHVLLAICLAVAATVLVQYRRLVSLPVSPAWASYTFPYVIVAVALGRYAGALENPLVKSPFQVIAWLALLHCLVMTIIVDFLYLRMLFSGQLEAPYAVEKVPVVCHTHLHS